MDRFRYTVATLLFNRPEETSRFLDSLARQRLQISPDDMIFSIDGYSGSKDEHLGRADRTGEIAELVRDRFPEATVMSQPANLGIAAHFAAVEAAAFERPGEWAVFLEDDYVLSPLYTEALSALLDYVTPFDRIAIASATGDTRVARDRGLDTLYPMDHAWAFALRRSHYEERRPIIDRYLAAMADNSYFQRSGEAINASLAPSGVFPLGTSQDAVKQAIRRRTGKLAVTTALSFGEYIGVTGEHFTPEVFEALGYDSPREESTVIQHFEEPLENLIPILDDEEHAMWAAQAGDSLASILGARDAAIEARDAAIAEASSANEHAMALKAQLDDSEREVSRLRAELAANIERAVAAETRANAAERDVAEIRNTKSWNLTAPLRWTESRIRRRG